MIYVVSNIHGDYERFKELLEKISEGAVLLVTSDDAALQPLGPAEIVIEGVSDAAKPASFKSELIDFTIPRKTNLQISPREGTEILAVDEEGLPSFCCASYGKGKILFLNAPLEHSLLTMPGAFEENAPDYSAIYKVAAEKAGIKRVVKRADRQLTLTEHPVDDATVAVVIVNNSRTPRQAALEIAAPWKVEKCINGTFADGKISIGEKTGSILFIKK